MQHPKQANRVGEEDTAVAPEGDAAAEGAALVVPSAAGIDRVEEGGERARFSGQGRGGVAAAIRRSVGFSAVLLVAIGCAAVAAIGATRPQGRWPGAVAGGGVVVNAVEMTERSTGFLPLSAAPAPAHATMRVTRINATAIMVVAVNASMPLNATRLNATAMVAAANTSEGSNGSEGRNESENSSNESENSSNESENTSNDSENTSNDSSANASAYLPPHKIRAVPINATHVMVLVPDSSMLRHTDTAGTGITAHKVNSSAVILGVESGGLEVEVVNGTAVKFSITEY